LTQSMQRTLTTVARCTYSDGVKRSYFTHVLFPFSKHFLQRVSTDVLEIYSHNVALAPSEKLP